MAMVAQPVPRHSGLAGRRSLQERVGKVGISIVTKSAQKTKRIEWIDDFSARYELLDEVMPSSHKYMQVLFAKRRNDSESVVVKVRRKPKCFRGRDDEREWRCVTEFMLNMPDDAGVVKLHEVLEDGGALYVVMERVNGPDLFETLSGEGFVAPDLAQHIIFQILEATAHLHQQGLVHKDLKLENVVVDGASPKLFTPKSGRLGGSMSPITPSVKLIDFDTVMEWTPSSPKTRDVLGTDQYIAPEAYDGRYSPLSDVFAVGVIAYKLLAGSFPFPQRMFDDEAGENWVGSPKMQQIRRRLKRYEVEMDKSVFLNNPSARDLVSKMLACDENQRPSAEACLAHEWFAGMDRRSQSPKVGSGQGLRVDNLSLPMLALGGDRSAGADRPPARQGSRAPGGSPTASAFASPWQSRQLSSGASVLLGAGGAVAQCPQPRTPSGSTTSGSGRRTGSGSTTTSDCPRSGSSSAKP